MSPTEAAILSYFHGEKMAGALVLPLGLAFAAAGFFLFFRTVPHRATAWPLWVGAALQIGIGIVLVLRSDAQAQGVIAGIADLSAETQRMAGVIRTFTILKIVWCAIIVACVVAPYVLAKPWVRPVAVGIVANAAVVLIFDLVADARARVYLAALESG